MCPGPAREEPAQEGPCWALPWLVLVPGAPWLCQWYPAPSHCGRKHFARVWEESEWGQSCSSQRGVERAAVGGCFAILGSVHQPCCNIFSSWVDLGLVQWFSLKTLSSFCAMDSIQYSELQKCLFSASLETNKTFSREVADLCCYFPSHLW